MGAQSGVVGTVSDGGLVKTPNIWHNISSKTAIGDTALWTPTTGRKFRLMAGIIALSKEAACAGAFNVQLLDGAGVFFRIDICNAALVATGQVILIPFNFGPNGYLSTAVNNVLNLTFNAALSAGAGSAVVWGTEE
jgi:hypothetical protein